VANGMINILVTRDAGLRSALAAGLGVAGLTLMTVDSCDSPRIGEYLRRASILILDDDLTTESRLDWIARLKQRAPNARIILLVNITGAKAPPEVACVPKRQAVRSILALTELWSNADRGVAP
jgi:ActR/RegA family two-component response regulator